MTRHAHTHTHTHIHHHPLTGAKSTKVFGRLGNDVGPQCHDDASGGLAADGDVEVAHGIGPAHERGGGEMARRGEARECDGRSSRSNPKIMRMQIILEDEETAGRRRMGTHTPKVYTSQRQHRHRAAANVSLCAFQKIMMANRLTLLQI